VKERGNKKKKTIIGAKLDIFCGTCRPRIEAMP